jgi:DNA-binding response OmpR family regulator
MQKHLDILRRSRTAVATSGDVRVFRGGRKVVVMVDDDSDVRATVALVLEDAGYEVVECADLASAFAVLPGIIPDVLLLDRELPDGSGLQLAAWMRRQCAFDEVRIVAFSGRDSWTDIEAAMSAGCDDFVAKPCRPEALLRGIHGPSRTSRTSRGARTPLSIGAVTPIMRAPTSTGDDGLSATARAAARRG